MPTDILINALTTLSEALEGITPLPTATFTAENGTLSLATVSNFESGLDLEKLPDRITLTSDEIEEVFLGCGTVICLSNHTNTIPGLISFASLLGLEKVVFYPLHDEDSLRGLVLVGDQNGTLQAEDLQPITKINQLVSTIFSQTAIIENSEKITRERDVINALVSAMNPPWDMTAFFDTLYEQIRKYIGGFAFTYVTFDETTSAMSIPYESINGIVRTFGAFPLGESLPSLILQTKRPLLLNDNVQIQAEALGANLDGEIAKSWMGTPLLIDERVIGALIVQDLEKESSFTEDNLHFLDTLARQVSRILFNAQIFEESQNIISKLQTANEIARDISSALNLDELLRKAINLIRERFNFYHVSIFLINPDEHCAVIREATGEAGEQLKRIGHKLAVTSKSIVGYVAGKGEPLVVNDIKNDATFLPDQMLPDTRAEAAIPLKIGEHILGVLDVQSTTPYSFGTNDINIFQTLADQLSIAVNNSELFGEIQEHLSQHRLLHHITTSAASGTTLEEALNSAVKGLQVTLGGDRVSILLSDEERKSLTVKSWVGYSDNTVSVNIPFGSGITGWVAAHRKALRVNDIRQDARYIMVSANTRSELAIPLIFRNDILGVLNVESEQINAYNENDEEMLGTLAGSLAAIMANARLVDQVRKQAERERILNEVSSKIRRSTDLHTILNTTVQELQRVTNARTAKIKIGIPTDKDEGFIIDPKNARELLA